MNIRLSSESNRIIEKNCHNGEGSIVFREIFKKDNFKSSIQFLHETEILPNSTIGYHKHEGNEEIYYIISGKGLMMVDNYEKEVGPGDAIITQSGSSHGLKNTGSTNLKILVFEAVY